MNEETIDSIGAAQMLGVTSNNLRQFVFRKLLSPIGKDKRRSLFNLGQVEQLKASRNPIVNPSV